MSGILVFKGENLVSDPYRAEQESRDLRWLNNLKPPEGTRCVVCGGKADFFWYESLLCDSCFVAAFKKAKIKQKGKLSRLLVGRAKIVNAGGKKAFSFFCSSQVET